MSTRDESGSGHTSRDELSWLGWSLPHARRGWRGVVAAGSRAAASARLTAYLRREGGAGLRLVLRQGVAPEGLEARAEHYDFGHLGAMLDAPYEGTR